MTCRLVGSFLRPDADVGVICATIAGLRDVAARCVLPVARAAI